MKKISTLVVLIATLLTNVATAQIQGVVTGTQIGNKATDLKFTTPDGKALALSSLKGKVVLLDFWASWCRPCRMENPNVVATYNKYKDTKFGKAKGFTVYSVSLDDNKDKWTAAIKADGLTWASHVSDLKGWSSQAAQVYGVNSIPTNWLINENGIIVAQGLRGEALENALLQLRK
ncbi:MAG: TlpA disulfide reductase family protein [Bacteroidia bacterium]